MRLTRSVLLNWGFTVESPGDLFVCLFDAGHSDSVDPGSAWPWACFQLSR